MNLIPAPESGNETNRRITRSQQSFSKATTAPVGLFFFGLIFVLIGLWICAIGLRWIPVNPASVKAPYSIVALSGIVFLIGGTMVWGMAARQFALLQKLRNPDGPEAALRDYPWNRTGFTPSIWRKQISGLVGLGVFFIMALILNWAAFSTNENSLVQFIAVLFSLATLAILGVAVRNFWHALKFGQSRLIFPQFPYFAGETVALEWKAPDSIREIRSGRFCLNCIEETVVRSSRGKGNRVQHSRIWCQELWLEAPHTLWGGESTPLVFHVPSELPSTEFGSSRSIFWDLEIKLDVPGLDFSELYLVPIYHRQKSPHSS